MLLRCCWVGVGGWGMLTYLVLRTWSSATLLRSLGWFTTWHVATLLLGWGGGVGDVNVPCTSYMIQCYFVHVPTTDRRRSVLLTDGARCYKTMSSTLNLLHGVVNHSAVQFTAEMKRGREVIQVHTGTIDQVWSGCKAFIPKQLGSQSKLIEVYLRAFQWRYINRLTLIRTKTIHQLNLLRKWRKTKCAVCVLIDVIGKTTFSKKTCTAPQREEKNTVKPL